MKAALSRRDTDIARLREIRDQQLAELHERKQKDAGKMTSTQEFKALAESRAVCVINSLIYRYLNDLTGNDISVADSATPL